MGKTRFFRYPMSFYTEVYPHRNDRQRFVRILLQKLPREFTRLSESRERVSLESRWDSFDDYLLGPDRVVVRSRAVRAFDRDRVRGVLRAWDRQISDRYLDYRVVRQFATARHQPEFADLRERMNDTDDTFERSAIMREGHARAYRLLRGNFPGGAVCFIRNEVERSNLFGSRLGSQVRDPEQISYNMYYNWILDWDGAHSFGLVNYLQRQSAMLGVFGGGSALNWYWQGASRWIHNNGRRGIYQYYFLPD